jgi:hypothetical protein
MHHKTQTSQVQVRQWHSLQMDTWWTPASLLFLRFPRLYPHLMNDNLLAGFSFSNAGSIISCMMIMRIFCVILPGFIV